MFTTFSMKLRELSKPPKEGIRLCDVSKVDVDENDISEVLKKLKGEPYDEELFHEQIRRIEDEE